MSKLLKNLYNKEYIQILEEQISLNYASFDAINFTKKVFDEKWCEKRLKQRMRHISNTLYHFLPKEYDKSISILKNTFLNMNTQYALENMIFQDFVEIYGLDYFDISMDALSCFTINSSSEFAIRQFILKYPTQTIKQMKKWARDENEHLRRLSSEGCRPRLPWAIALQEFIKNPKEILNILDILKNDKSKYVRKSVANNLNDISKDNPETVKNIVKQWIGNSDNTDMLLKHGCRTLLKNADTEILEIFGFNKNSNISINNFTLNKNIKMGENLQFSFILNSNEIFGKLRIEYAIKFLRQNNKYSKKVFKISEGIYNQKNKKIIKNYSFKPISTRKYYSGLHKLSIIVNGIVLNEEEFVIS